jgi:hypothetical protein
LILSVAALPAGSWPVPPTNPEPPGARFTPPVQAEAAQEKPAEGEAAAEPPVINAHSDDVLPDQSVVLVGSGLGEAQYFLWGGSPTQPGGQRWELAASVQSDDLAIFTLPTAMPSGVCLLWPGQGDRWEQPIRLNAPEAWWCTPDRAQPGQSVRICGRNLAAKPDYVTAFVYLVSADGKGRWLEAQTIDKYYLDIALPADVPTGRCELWVHAGSGGVCGWGEPVVVDVVAPPKGREPVVFAQRDAAALQKLVDRVAEQGGGEVRLPAGEIQLPTTLVVPAGVQLRGEGTERTTLRLSPEPAVPMVGIGQPGWGQIVTGLHTPGDTLVYAFEVPKAGTWQLWVRYGADNARYNIDDMGDHCSLSVDGGPARPLEDLPNTGGWGHFRWGRTAALKLEPGRHEITWRNEKAGGIALDAWVLAADPEWSPEGNDPVDPAPARLIKQAEAPLRYDAKDIRFPSLTTAVVWLRGDGAAVSDLSILGNARTPWGVVAQSPDGVRWIDGVGIQRVRIADIEGHQRKSGAILLQHTSHARVENCRLHGQTPLFLSGVRQSRLADNRLLPACRTPGGAEGAILGRTEPLAENIIENNVVENPVAGGPQVRRLIWVSTGAGSVNDNLFRANRAVNPRFGGTAGGQQNVGEMILLESHMRYAFFGNPAATGADSIGLPENAPVLPPDQETGGMEPTASQHYAVVLAGRGQGQVRRIVGREGRTLKLRRPWRVVPDEQSKILISTLFARNLILENETCDGMTGIQIWIGGWQNVVARNRIARQRKPGIYLYAATTTLDAQMPPTWNRGIGALLFNTIEENHIEQASNGIFLLANNRELPVEWPRAVGTVLRRNTIVNSRFEGMRVTAAGSDASPAVAGTVVEFNVVRDQHVGISTAATVRGAAVRRNHLYFWDEEYLEDEPTALRLLGPDTVESQNTVEGPNGVPTGEIQILGAQ